MTPLPADRALDAYFLDARAKLLDLAAMLDRLGRGSTAVPPADRRLDRLLAGLKLLAADAVGIDRAAAVQRLFSSEYDPAWTVPQPRM